MKAKEALVRRLAFPKPPLNFLEPLVSVGSTVILCLHNVLAVEVMHVSFVPCLINPKSHYSVSLFRVSPFRVSFVPCFICSMSHLFCGLFFQYLKYSVSQDLDRFSTLRLCLNFKPRLGINHA